jgi:demethylmenaquinone methyltransferase/2-methoxy-6-polyprenyl-1,4-benzoquinol methylase
MADQNPLLQKQGNDIRRMFAGIAHRYDLLNRLLSGWVDTYWRRCTVRLAPPTVEGPLLDVCTGTGDLALAYKRKNPGRMIVGTDFCREMLVYADTKGAKTPDQNMGPVFLEADTLALPLLDNHFALTSVAFGLRNTQDPHLALAEMLRVTCPGGSLVILEFSMPKWPIIGGLYRWYFRAVLPRIGQLFSKSPDAAYAYLPQSVNNFPQDEALCSWIREAGWLDVTYRHFTLGIATLYTGLKPPLG